MANHDPRSASDGDELSDWGLGAHATGSKTETKVGLSLVVVLLGALSFLVYRKLSDQGLTVAAADDSPTIMQSEDDERSPANADHDIGDDSHPLMSSSDGATFELGTTDATYDDAGGAPPGQFEPAASPTPDWNQPPAGRAPTASTDPWMNSGATAVDASPAPQTPAEPNPFATNAVPLSAPGARDGGGGDADSQSWSSDAAAADAPAFPEAAVTDADGSSPVGPVFDLFGGDATEPAEPAPAHDAAAAQAPRPGNEPLRIDIEPGEVVPTGGDDFGAVEVDQAGGDAGTWDLGSDAGAADPFGDPAPAAAPQTPVEFDLDSNVTDPTPAPAPEFNLEPTPAPVVTPAPASDTDRGTPWGSPTSTVQRPAPPADPFAGTGSGASTFGDDVTIHTVESRDSFWSISRQHYGSGKYFNALAAYNRPRIPDPRTMRPGMKVLIPDVGVLEQRFPNLAGVAYSPSDEQKQPGFFVSSTGQPMYRVGKNDTLSSIAVRHLGRASRWRQIYGMNSTSLKGADSLKIGMELRLPPDATRVTVVPSNVSVR